MENPLTITQAGETVAEYFDLVVAPVPDADQASADLRVVVFNDAGDMLDPATGECLVPAAEPVSLDEPIKVSFRFQVEDMNAVHWVLRRRMVAAEAVETCKRMKLIALANCDVMIQRAQTEMDRIDSLYLADIKKVAEDELAQQTSKKKLKSIKTPFGTLQFTGYKGGPEVVDEGALLAYLHEHKLESAIDVEKKITDISAAIDALEVCEMFAAISTREVVLPAVVQLIQEEGIEIPDELFKVVPAGDKFSIKHDATGVAPPAKKTKPKPGLVVDESDEVGE